MFEDLQGVSVIDGAGVGEGVEFMMALNSPYWQSVRGRVESLSGVLLAFWNDLFSY